MFTTKYENNIRYQITIDIRRDKCSMGHDATQKNVPFPFPVSDIRSVCFQSVAVPEESAEAVGGRPLVYPPTAF